MTTNKKTDKMERKSTFSQGEKMIIGTYKRAHQHFKKQYPTIDFDSMVLDVMKQTDSDSPDDIPSRDWMKLNIAMQNKIHETFPPKQIVSDPELEERTKRAWMDEIRRTTPRNKFGFGTE